MFDLDVTQFGLTAPSGLVVHAAMLFQMVGLLLRGQVALRLLVLIGTGLYVVYYAVAAPEPLWDAIYASLLIGLANLIGLLRILTEPMEVLIRPRDRPIFDRMEAIAPGAILPGQFRRLMRIARRGVARRDIVVTAPDHYPEELVLVLDGTARVEWGADVERRRHPRFIGEVAFVRGPPGMGRVVLEEGSNYVAWPMGRLRRMLARNPPLDRALRAVVAQELATKMDFYVRRAALLRSGIDPDELPRESGNAVGALDEDAVPTLVRADPATRAPPQEAMGG